LLLKRPLLRSTRITTHHPLPADVHRRSISESAALRILRYLGEDKVEVYSAGTVATRAHPLAIAAMAEKGIDISTQRSKHVDELSGQKFDYVITVCDNARESCPIFPGAVEPIHWSIADPSAVEGDEAVRSRAFRVASDELMTRIRYLLVLIERKRR